MLSEFAETGTFILISPVAPVIDPVPFLPAEQKERIYSILIYNEKPKDLDFRDHTVRRINHFDTTLIRKRLKSTERYWKRTKKLYCKHKNC